MTSEQQAIVNNGKSVAQSFFDGFISDFTFGLFPDVNTAIIAVVSCIALYIAFDLIATVVFKFDISEELEYREYRNKRSRSEKFRSRYESEKNPPKTAPKVGAADNYSKPSLLSGRADNY